MQNRLLIFSCLLANCCFAQVDTNSFTRQVEVSALANKPLESSFYQPFDSLAFIDNLSVNLADLLGSQSGVFIKDYGPGQLSTPTFRGGDATQTVVLYNGAKINSPTLGSIDFTLIPTSQFSRIGLLSSASSNVFASGGIGGGVELESKINLQDFFVNATAGVGSFGTNNSQLDVNYPFQFGSIKLAVYYSNSRFEAENNFNYTDIYSIPYSEKLRKHSSIDVLNQQLNLAILLSSKTYLQINSWNTRANRNIPKPINLRETFTQFQNDISNRVQLLLNHEFNQQHKLDLMVFHDRTSNQYQDSLAGIDNSNDYDNGQLQLAWSWQPKNGYIKLYNQLTSNYTAATSKNFDGLKTQLGIGSLHRFSWESKLKKLRFDLGTRTLKQDDVFEWLPFISGAFNLSSKYHLNLFSSISRSARFATLNELYWQPGGNTNLQSEVGTSAEFGLKREVKSEKFNFSLTAYASQIKDRIRWLPNGAVFSPINIAESRNFGLDLNFNHCLYQTREVSLFLRNSMSLVYAKGRVQTADDFKTLSFIPMMKSSSSINLDVNKWKLLVTQTFTSKRYITSNETAYMPAYSLLDVVTSYRFKFLDISLSIENCLNTGFQNLPWRPMPGRSFHTQIAFRL